MLPDMNDVAVDLIRGTAARHQFHEGAPPFGDGCETRKDRDRTQGAAFRLEFFKGPQDLGFFGRHSFYRVGRITGERSALRSQGDCQRTRSLDLSTMGRRLRSRFFQQR